MRVASHSRVRCRSWLGFELTFHGPKSCNVSRRKMKNLRGARRGIVAKISTRLSSLGQKRRLRPDNYAGKWSQLHPLQWWRFISFWIGTGRRWRQSRPAFFRSRKAGAKRIASRRHNSDARFDCPAGLRQHAVENCRHRRWTAKMAGRSLLRRRRAARSRPIHGAAARNNL